MKKSIRVALAGLLAFPVLALSAVVFAPVATFAADCPTDITNSTTPLQDGANCAQGNGQQTSLFGTGGVFQIVTNTLLFLIGAISVIMLIYGGIRYTISGGDSAAVTAAKNTILYAIVGIIVAILAFAIVNFVITKLSATS
jgi:hypothetical protein